MAASSSNMIGSEPKSSGSDIGLTSEFSAIFCTASLGGFLYVSKIVARSKLASQEGQTIGSLHKS